MNYEVLNICRGVGGWGRVFSCRRVCDGKLFAVKFFGYVPGGPPDISAVNSEIVLMMALAGVEGVCVCMYVCMCVCVFAHI